MYLVKRLKTRKRQQKSTQTKYQIDQSGKIEQTNKVTIVAFSNDKSGSVMLSASDKRALQEIYRKAGKPRVFPTQVFAALA